MVRKAIRAGEMYEKYNLVNGAARCHAYVVGSRMRPCWPINKTN